MARPDGIGPMKLDFDAERQASSFQVSGWRKGKPFILSGCVPVAVPKGTRLVDIESFVAKAELKEFLRELIATL
jgi:hypothetical protein